MRLCLELQKLRGVEGVIGNQVLRSGTSIGANVEEAQAAQSRPDFVSKMTIAQKECRETAYWLRLLTAAEIMPAKRLDPLCEEAEAITKIISKIIISTKERTAR